MLGPLHFHTHFRKSFLNCRANFDEILIGTIESILINAWGVDNIESTDQSARFIFSFI